MILKNNNVKLEPFQNEKDFEYLIYLESQDRYRIKASDTEILKSIKKYGEWFWKVYHNDILGGVIFVQKNNDYYTIDGYSEKEVIDKLDNKISYAKWTVLLVLEFLIKQNIKPKILVNNQNRGLRMLCYKTGFKRGKEIKMFNNKYNIYELKEGE